MCLTTSEINFKVIPFDDADRPTTYRIVDQDNVLIAKINGKHNVPIAEKMIADLGRCERMASLLRWRLIDILKNNTGSSMWAIVGRDIATNGSNEQFNNLIKDLKSQMEDSPVVMTSILGGEAVQILEVL